ncbi:unnamed protein product [Candida verbasci]|uniref:Uncharacterized protein n=1 Tax=Candida verbasci TaxID=1227364 RepID=A0A9W4TV27_9ASCO|nr:unnamed protein product [Candida verbasci]
MVTKRIFHIAQFKTASRHWLPITQSTINSRAFFSSKQRCVNFNNLNDSTSASLVSNDDVFTTASQQAATSSEDLDVSFEPTVNSSEEIFTAGPVNRV